MHVVPSDVETNLSSRKVDPRLFNVTELVRSGYDDASSPVIPLIVQGGATALQGGRALPSIGGVAVKADKSTPFWSAARASGAERIWLDGAVKPVLDKSVPQIGAPEAWQAGHTGKGTTVAVLDTGVDATHLVRSRDQWVASVVHPKDAKFVSLKAQARDAAGNSVDQTIIRAYALK